LRPRLLLLAFLALATALAAVRPLAEPDEGRYAEAAREILVDGRLLPTQAGVPYPDKPPGAYWCMDGAFLLLGPTALAARLPALLALAGTLLLVLAAGRRGPAGTSLLAGLVLLSSPMALALGQLATLDMLLTTAVAAAVLAGHAWLHGGRRRSGLLAGLALGAGFLVKGPVAWLLPLAILLTTAVLERPRPPLRRLFHPVLWGPALLLGLPWYVVVVLREPGLLEFWLLRETVDRVASDLHRRAQPLWFFPALAAATTLPWLLWLLGRRLRHGRCRPAPGAGLPPLWGVWAVLPILLFSLPQGKQPAYLAPALPGMALAMGALLARPGRSRSGRTAGGVRPRRATRLALILLLVDAAAGAWFLVDEERTRSHDAFAEVLLEGGADTWPGAQVMGWSYGLGFRLERADLVALGPPPPAWSWALETGRVQLPPTREERLAAAGTFLARTEPAWLLVHELHPRPELDAELATALETAGARAWVWRRTRRNLLLANRPLTAAQAPYAPPEDGS